MVAVSQAGTTWYSNICMSGSAMRLVHTISEVELAINAVMVINVLTIAYEW